MLNNMHNHCISDEPKSTKTEVFIINAQQRLQDNLIICGSITYSSTNSHFVNIITKARPANISWWSLLIIINTLVNSINLR
jgi:hypothetical protein